MLHRIFGGRPPRAMLHLLAFAVALATAACSSKGGTEPTGDGANGSIVGTWELVSIGGRALPTNTGDGVRLVSYVQTYSADNTFRIRITQRLPEFPQDIPADLTGRWRIANGRVLLRFDVSGEEEFVDLPSTSGSTITSNFAGEDWVFRRS